jgi:hypothetical protein
LPTDIRQISVGLRTGQPGSEGSDDRASLSLELRAQKCRYGAILTRI